MWKQLVIVAVTFVVVCNANNNTNQEIARKGPFKYHHHGLYHGLRHYWIFLAIKAKIIFLIGTFISFWIFAGKAFAFLYYISKKESCKCADFHQEKFVLPEEPPHFEHKYSTLINAGPPSDYNGQFDKPPGYFSPYGGYSGYSARSLKDSIISNKDFIRYIVNGIDVTDVAFDTMKLKSTCRKRFVCELEHQSKKHDLLTLGMYMFSDVGLMKYKTNTTQNSINDCYILGPHCDKL